MTKISEVRELGQLHQGWDGHDGVPTRQEAISTALAAHAVPMSDGGLQLEWHAGGANIEIEIDPEGNFASVSWSRPND